MTLSGTIEEDWQVRKAGKSLKRVLLGRDGMVLALTWVAGGVDAISYLGLGHVFTANMTGNAVLLGLALGQGNGLAALRSIIALIGFALGVAMGAVIIERGPNQGRWPRAVTQAIVLESIILVVFVLTWHLLAAPFSHRALYALIMLSALTMGIQSAAIRQLNVPGVATTYITGTITSLIAGFSGWILRGRRLQVASLDLSTAPRPGARLQAAVLSLYLLAAVASGLIQTRDPRLATLSPLIAVLFVVLNSVFRRHDVEA